MRVGRHLQYLRHVLLLWWSGCGFCGHGFFLGRGLNKPHSQAKEKIMVTRRAILVFLVVLVCFFAAVYSQNISKKHRD